MLSFACCHHIVIDGSGLASVCQRIASVYSAVVSGAPVTPTIFGSLQDLLDCELRYETSNDYLEDQAYWTKNLPSGGGRYHRSAEAPGGVIRRGYRRQLLVTIFTLVGIALVAQGAGGM
jgi:hypothetical protein